MNKRSVDGGVKIRKKVFWFIPAIIAATGVSAGSMAGGAAGIITAVKSK